MAPQRWPEMLTFLDGNRDNFKEYGNFQDQLKTSADWYLEQFPVLSTDRRLEMENISALAAATVFFCLDLKLLAAADSPNTLDALSASDHNGVWELIDQVVETKFANFSHYIKAYLRWVFVKKEEQVWEVGGRPPVGRYSPGAQRRLARGGSDTRPTGGGGNRRPPSGGGQGQRGGGPNGNRRDAGPRNDRQDRDGPRPPREGGGDRGARKLAPQKTGHAELERIALEAVRTAVDKMRDEPHLAEVRLDPSNSFFRRLQHKKAVSEGFFSYSTGEGQQRAVVVTREKQEHEDLG